MNPPQRLVPDAALARSLAKMVIGHEPVSVSRFTTGFHHHVFEVCFFSRAPVVVRLATPENRAAMIGAHEISQRLRPLGVPLPEILAADLDAAFPYLILERFPGTDLIGVVHRLSDAGKRAISSKVVEAQKVVSTHCAISGRYGHAVYADDAPYESWSESLIAKLEMARKALQAGGLFDPRYAETIANLISAHRNTLDNLPASPFLHDTTTKNVIVTPDGEFSGIVDVDDLCFGDPRSVVALTLVSLANLGAATDYVDFWMASAGFSADRLFYLYAALTSVSFMSEHGQSFNGNAVVSTEQNRNHILKLAGRFIRQAEP
jgi:aminoglycoside phosphotransferase